MWIYSSGFPKSQDIGKSIDRQSGKASHKAELAEVKAILHKLYSDSGKSTAEISRECGFNAGGYLKTDFKDKGWANNLPKDDKWIKLKSVLGCGDDYDDYFVTTPQVKVGEKSAGCFDQDFDNYTIGARSKTVDITASQTAAGKTWSGWGTALKPAHEPICLARKPIKLSIAKNCQTHGVGALNIDATRVPYAEDDTLEEWKQRYPDVANGTAETHANFNPELQGKKKKKSDKEKIMDWANKYTSPGMQEYAKLDGSSERTHTEEQYKPTASPIGRFPSNVLGDISDYQKYFYCPKVSRAERHVGFETPPAMFGNVQGAYAPDGNRMAVGFDTRGIATEASMLADMGGYYVDDNNTETKVTGKNIWLPQTGRIYVHGLKDEYQKWCKANNKTPNVGNNHPTVKPIELMRYLIRLITPPGGTVLDPFNGSGSTGCAAVELGHEYIGCELDPAYVEIAKKRIEAWLQHVNPIAASGLFE